ncbi:MAG: hypothetical protein QXX01_03015 [Candidatus Aenigmatarchaeota archaeon]
MRLAYILILIFVFSNISYAQVFDINNGVSQGFNLFNAFTIGITAGIGGIGIFGFLRGNIRNFIIENSNKIKNISDIAGWISVGLMVAGGILMISGIGAPLGAYLLAAGFGMGVASSVADISVGLARKSAGINDMDDNLRLIFAPLGFIPVGKTVGQVGKQVGKRVGKEFIKRELEDMSKYVTKIYKNWGGKLQGLIPVKATNLPLDTYAQIRYELQINKMGNILRIPKVIEVNKLKFNEILKYKKDILLHEITHTSVSLPKFQKYYFPLSSKTKEVTRFFEYPPFHLKQHREFFTELTTDLICLKSSKTYGETMLKIKRYGEKLNGRISEMFIDKMKKIQNYKNFTKDLEKTIEDIKRSPMKKYLPSIIPIPLVQKK